MGFLEDELDYGYEKERLERDGLDGFGSQPEPEEHPDPVMSAQEIFDVTACEMRQRVIDGTYGGYVQSTGLLDRHRWVDVCGIEDGHVPPRFYDEYIGPDGLPSARVYEDGTVLISGRAPIVLNDIDHFGRHVVAMYETAINEEFKKAIGMPDPTGTSC